MKGDNEVKGKEVSNYSISFAQSVTGIQIQQNVDNSMQIQPTNECFDYEKYQKF